MKKLLAVFLSVLFSSVVFSQSAGELFDLGVKAYKAKNFPHFLELMQRLDSLRPNHPTYTYKLAVAYSLNNEKEKAASVMKHMILMNNKVDFEMDPDLAILKESDDYQNLVRLKSDLEKIIKKSEKMISLADRDLHPEGLIFLSKHNLWLASSIRKKKIISFDPKTGTCIDWFSESQFSVFAMKADKEEKFLWVTTTAMPEMIGFSKKIDGRAEVLKIDIKTKKIIKRFSVEGNHVFGDLVVNDNDDVYVSDSNEALIYKISNDTITHWLDLKSEAFNLQGLTFDRDQSKLYIADYLKGILVIDVNNPLIRNWMNFPEYATSKGIDGLVFYENSLFAIHNGVKPIRIIQYSLNNKQDNILGFNIIDNNRPEFDEPALAVIINDKLYFFSNSPWKAYDKNFNLDSSKFDAPALYQYDIVK